MQFWTYKEDSFLPYLLKASKHLTILGEVWGALSAIWEHVSHTTPDLHN